MNADPLEALRPLHLPDPVSWWPPAPLWWVMALLSIVIITLLGRAIWRRLRRNAYRRAAASEIAAALSEVLASGDRAAFLARASGTLRRAALCRYPRHTVAPLHGREWLAFLDQSGRMNGFSEGAGDALGRAVYAPTPDCDPERIATLCREWLRRHR